MEAEAGGVSAAPTLSDILAWEKNEAIAELVARPRRYVIQAKNASEEERARLAQLLGSLWPEGGLAPHIDLDALKVSAGVYALLELGAAADMPLSHERWAQVATSGIALSDQVGWLRRQYTPDAAELAVEMCDADDVRSWEQLVAAVPDEEPLPASLVAALSARVKRLRRPDDQLHLTYIGERLAREGHQDALEKLAGVGEFGDRLDPALARAGSAAAGERLLNALENRVAAGESVDRLDLEWLNGLNDRDLLPLLISALRTTIERGATDPFGPAGALVSTIRRIGNAEAVAAYDALIDESDTPEFKFLRKPRDELLDDILRRVGQEQALETCRSLGLPQMEALPTDDLTPA